MPDRRNISFQQYQFHNQQLSRLVKSAIQYFNAYKLNKSLDDLLQQAIQKIVEARNEALALYQSSPNLQTASDYIHILLTYDNLLKKSDAKFRKALLLEARATYDTYGHSNPTEIISLLIQIDQVALDAHDGGLLVENANRIIATHFDQPELLYIAYRSLFRAALARRDVENAEIFLEKISALPNLSESDQASCIRFQAKLNLAKLMLGNEPITNELLEADVLSKRFWEMYDAHKLNPRSDKDALMSDLYFLFFVRCLKSQLGFDEDKAKPREYMLIQAKHCFKKYSPNYNKMEKWLTRKIEEIRVCGFLTLDFKFFPDAEPLRLNFSQSDIARMFPSEIYTTPFLLFNQSDGDSTQKTKSRRNSDTVINPA